MSWVRVTDDATLHPKVVAVGLAGWGFFVASLCYANHYLTDGMIPIRALPAVFPGISPKRALTIAVELVSVGLWEKRDEGWVIHDYHQYQPTREEEIAERAARHAQRWAAGKARASKARRIAGRFATGLRSANGPASHQRDASGLGGVALVPADQRDTSPVPVPVPVVVQTPNGVLSGERPTARLHRVDQATEVLDFLNAKTGRSFEAKTPAGTLTGNAKLVIDRLKEGRSVQDCKGVIARKCRQWKGTDMEKYTRPATLFSKSNFDTYIGEREREPEPEPIP